jgi:chromosome segregation ATPase
MPNHDGYREDSLTACERCRDNYEDDLDALEKQVQFLEDEIERVSAERDEAKERYAQLVETVSARTDQRQSMADPRD